jgi:hypothetical protein
MKQEREHLIEHLRDQVGFLQKRGTAFDEGDVAEAKQLAVAIRVLVHDPTRGRSRSLLRQLGVKRKLRFVDTSYEPAPPGVIRFDAGLAVIRMGGDEGDPTTYVAPLADRPRRSPRESVRWCSDPVLIDDEGVRFSRHDLVSGLAHKEGGAHVDPDLERAYARMVRSNSLGWEFGRGDEWVAAGSPVPANVRQIGWELQTTVEEQLGDLL